MLHLQEEDVQVEGMQASSGEVEERGEEIEAEEKQATQQQVTANIVSHPISHPVNPLLPQRLQRDLSLLKG